MQVKILNVNVEHVVKGKSRYDKATVAYLYNGEARTQNVMSFSNPAIFKAVQEFVGQEVEVTVTKNAAGYNEWAAILPAGSTAVPSSSTASAPTNAPATRVTGSNFETPSERAQKQIYIVKQSSISAAIALAGLNKEKVTREQIIDTAQFFVDYVFGNDKTVEGMASDTP